MAGQLALRAVAAGDPGATRTLAKRLVFGFRPLAATGERSLPDGLSIESNGQSSACADL